MAEETKKKKAVKEKSPRKQAIERAREIENEMKANQQASAKQAELEKKAELTDQQNTLYEGLEQNNLFHLVDDPKIHRRIRKDLMRDIEKGIDINATDYINTYKAQHPKFFPVKENSVTTVKEAPVTDTVIESSEEDQKPVTKKPLLYQKVGTNEIVDITDQLDSLRFQLESWAKRNYKGLKLKKALEEINTNLSSLENHQNMDLIADYYDDSKRKHIDDNVKYQLWEMLSPTFGMTPGIESSSPSVSVPVTSSESTGKRSNAAGQYLADGFNTMFNSDDALSLPIEKRIQFVKNALLAAYPEIVKGANGQQFTTDVNNIKDLDTFAAVLTKYDLDESFYRDAFREYFMIEPETSTPTSTTGSDGVTLEDGDLKITEFTNLTNQYMVLVRTKDGKLAVRTSDGTVDSANYLQAISQQGGSPVIGHYKGSDGTYHFVKATRQNGYQDIRYSSQGTDGDIDGYVDNMNRLVSLYNEYDPTNDLIYNQILDQLSNGTDKYKYADITHFFRGLPEGLHVVVNKDSKLSFGDFDNTTVDLYQETPDGVGSVHKGVVTNVGDQYTLKYGDTTIQNTLIKDPNATANLDWYTSKTHKIGDDAAEIYRAFMAINSNPNLYHRLSNKEWYDIGNSNTYGNVVKGKGIATLISNAFKSSNKALSLKNAFMSHNAGVTLLGYRLQTNNIGYEPSDENYAKEVITWYETFKRYGKTINVNSVPKVMRKCGISEDVITKFLEQFVAVVSEGHSNVQQHKEGGILKAMLGMQFRDRIALDDVNSGYSPMTNEELDQLATLYANEFAAPTLKNRQNEGYIGAGTAEHSSLNGHDIADIVAGGMDLASLAGGPVGLILSAASLVTDAINQGTDDRYSKADVLKNIGWNLGFMALALVPGAAAGKFAKNAGKAAKMLNEAQDAAKAAAKAAGKDPKLIEKIVEECTKQLKHDTDLAKAYKKWSQAARISEKTGKVINGIGSAVGLGIGTAGAIDAAKDISEGRGLSTTEFRQLIGGLAGLRGIHYGIESAAIRRATTPIETATTPSRTIKSVKVNKTDSEIRGLKNSEGKPFFNEDGDLILDIKSGSSKTEIEAEINLKKQQLKEEFEKQHSTKGKSAKEKEAIKEKIEKFNEKIDNIEVSTKDILKAQATDKKEGWKDWWNEKTTSDFSEDRPRRLKTQEELDESILPHWYGVRRAKARGYVDIQNDPMIKKLQALEQVKEENLTPSTTAEDSATPEVDLSEALAGERAATEVPQASSEHKESAPTTSTEEPKAKEEAKSYTQRKRQAYNEMSEQDRLALYNKLIEKIRMSTKSKGQQLQKWNIAAENLKQGKLTAKQASQIAKFEEGRIEIREDGGILEMTDPIMMRLGGLALRINKYENASGDTIEFQSDPVFIDGVDEESFRSAYNQDLLNFFYQKFSDPTLTPEQKTALINTFNNLFGLAYTLASRSSYTPGQDGAVVTLEGTKDYQAAYDRAGLHLPSFIDKWNYPYNTNNTGDSWDVSGHWRGGDNSYGNTTYHRVANIMTDKEVAEANKKLKGTGVHWELDERGVNDPRQGSNGRRFYKLVEGELDLSHIQGGGTKRKKEKGRLGKLLQNVDLTPLAELPALVDALMVNKANYEDLSRVKAPYKMGAEYYLPVYDDFTYRQFAEKQAADYLRRADAEAAKYADPSKINQIKLNAFDKVAEFIDKAALQDEALYRSSVEKQVNNEKENLQRRVAITNANAMVDYQNDLSLAQLKAARRLKDWESRQAYGDAIANNYGLDKQYKINGNNQLVNAQAQEMLDLARQKYNEGLELLKDPMNCPEFKKAVAGNAAYESNKQQIIQQHSEMLEAWKTREQKRLLDEYNATVKQIQQYVSANTKTYIHPYFYQIDPSTASVSEEEPTPTSGGMIIAKKSGGQLTFAERAELQRQKAVLERVKQNIKVTEYNEKRLLRQTNPAEAQLGRERMAVLNSILKG